jgi:hypothetical protein
VLVNGRAKISVKCLIFRKKSFYFSRKRGRNILEYIFVELTFKLGAGSTRQRHATFAPLGHEPKSIGQQLGESRPNTQQTDEQAAVLQAAVDADE